MPDGKLKYRRGEIWWVELDPTRGAETTKTRPCLVLQNDIRNKFGAVTIVVPLLRGHKTYPFAVNVTATEQNGLDRDRYLHLGQLRAVSCDRVRNYQGTLEPHYWAAIKTAVLDVIGFGVDLD
ncbi:MAG: type II toxin-antitoxin system PemK/MazF family toxin [Cyanobacteria bacterium J06648_11]